MESTSSGKGALIHLDTNYLVDLSEPGSRAWNEIRDWIAAAEPLATSSVAWSEYLCGPVSPEAIALARQVVGDPVPFTWQDAELAADMFNASGRRRSVFRDCMIAASAVHAGAAVATSNVPDFKRMAPFGVVIAE